LAVLDRLIDEIHLLRSSLPGVLGAWYWQRHEQVFTAWLGMLVSDSRQRGNADGTASLLALSKMRSIDGLSQSARVASGDTDTTGPLRTLLAQRTDPDAGKTVFALNGRINTGLDSLRMAPGQDGEFPTDAGLKKYLRALEHDETVLTFHLGPEMAQVWVGNKAGVRRVDLANPAELYRKVQAGRQGLTDIGLGAFNNKMEELGKLLLHPVTDLLSDTVYCIPAGLLLGFPLDALRLNGHYLVERYNFVNLLSFPEKPNPSESLQMHSMRSMFLAGNPRDYAGDYATRLETSAEISAVADLFVGPGLQIIQGVALLPDEFQGEFIKQSNLVHLAMPGIINLKYPDESGLELSESEYEPGRVILMAPDIRVQSLGAGLVFLSSTRISENPRSGFSNRPGLVADFMTAGAGSVIVNFWATDAESDAPFITDFYRTLKDSGNIAGSLRKARLQYLKSGRDDGLYDWAGYQLYIR
jgi:CHAT domain-containing protein